MSAVELGWYFLLVLAGFAAGIVNSIAGGGSFLTLPALMLFGLDPKMANGTNRVAVLFSSASAVATFRAHGHFDRSLAIKVGVPCLIGVPLGSLLAVHLSADAFRGAFGILFLVMAAIILWDPKRLTAMKEGATLPHWKLAPVFVLIGICPCHLRAKSIIICILSRNIVLGA